MRKIHEAQDTLLLHCRPSEASEQGLGYGTLANSINRLTQCHSSTHTCLSRHELPAVTTTPCC